MSKHIKFHDHMSKHRRFWWRHMNNYLVSSRSRLSTPAIWWCRGSRTLSNPQSAISRNKVGKTLRPQDPPIGGARVVGANSEASTQSDFFWKNRKISVFGRKFCWIKRPKIHGYFEYKIFLTLYRALTNLERKTKSPDQIIDVFQELNFH